MHKILIADDEFRIRKLVKDFLKREDFIVLEASNGQEATEIFYKEENIDVVILDVMMPVVDGWSACREIRRNSNVPIIMLTARSQEHDELFGFEIGADEYVTKPFSPLILIARIKSLLNRVEAKSNTVNLNGLLVDKNARVVYLNNEPLDLSPIEYDLLLYLVENKNTACSRDSILNKVWGYDYYGNERTVDTHINRLRIKLKSKSGIIKTVRGFGYRLEIN
ncbi:response regulator transcription factor [Oceanirhabdus sp. W0125-5]|uniref:response regulator transcription factor n=1 Tax=Oceanirhabdus sp. W0125-5 TaxID=2999116 RepID=UPI0022F31679|nr:response regulator transcription factor [Oceanirhabdus sp. W0125-5]WBW99077.1 response regulator transcription factor [Oceanirhabdus sp. W0125-5]